VSEKLFAFDVGCASLLLPPVTDWLPVSLELVYVFCIMAHIRLKTFIDVK